MAIGRPEGGAIERDIAMTTNLAIRRAAQSHIANLRLESPFHPRLIALSQQNDWYSWGGYKAPLSLWDEEMEYFAIRSQAAVFDISPMVKYRVEGAGAEAFLNRLTLRNVAKLKPGKVQYTAWCDDEGHVLDDGTLFRLSATRFRLCCQERHLPWLRDSAIGFNVNVSDVSEDIAALSLQGPCAYAVLAGAGFDGAKMLKPFQLADYRFGTSGKVMISRTGFTADLGYELWTSPANALDLWDHLMTAGALHGLRPIGTTALNMARIEAGFMIANMDFISATTALRPDLSLIHI